MLKESRRIMNIRSWFKEKSEGMTTKDWIDFLLWYFMIVLYIISFICINIEKFKNMFNII